MYANKCLLMHILTLQAVCTAEDTCHSHGTCDTSGSCECDVGYNGSITCDQCSPDRYNYPVCTCNWLYGHFRVLIHYKQTVQRLTLATDSAIATILDNAFAILPTMEVARAINAGQIGLIFLPAHVLHLKFVLVMILFLDCTLTETCNGHGSCGVTGQCNCSSAFNGSATCNQCSPDHYAYPACTCTLLRVCGANTKLLNRLRCCWYVQWPRDVH